MIKRTRLLNLFWLIAFAACAPASEPGADAPAADLQTSDGALADVSEWDTASSDALVGTDVGVLDALASDLAHGEVTAADGGTPTDVGGDDLSVADVGADSGIDWSSLSGSVPAGDTSLPEAVAVVDQAGEPFSTDRLLGTWSVLWFYPMAGTTG